MPRYKRTAVIGKKGINFVQDVVESSGSLFHRIDQENDLGIDALIEFIDDEKPLGIQIGVQIKSGSSYYDKQRKMCRIPVGNHYEYWLKYPVPVFGIVVDPESQEANWVDIKKFFSQNGNVKAIKFNRSYASKFDHETFSKVFSSIVKKKTPRLDLQDSISLSKSSIEEDRMLGLVSLFRNHVNSTDTWDTFFNELKMSTNSSFVSYALAHIVWHPDIFYSGEMITNEIKDYCLNKIHHFGRAEVETLVDVIDEENGISRGTIGQHVECVLSAVGDLDVKLASIVADDSSRLKNREYSALIIAYMYGKQSLGFLKKYCHVSGFVADIVQHLEIEGELYY